MQIIDAPGKVTVRGVVLGPELGKWTSIPGVDSVLLTEVAPADRAAVLSVIEGWTAAHQGGPGQGECAILTRDAGQKVLATRWLTLTEGGGKARLTHPIVAVAVVVQLASGHVVVQTNAHLPAHIEGLWAKIPMPARTKVRAMRKHPGLDPSITAWIEAVVSWRKQVNALAAEFHADDVVVTGDWNLNAHRKWVQALLADVWPSLHLVATKAPDLGKRTVGFVLTTMESTGSSVHKAHASDHDAGQYGLRHVNKVPTSHKPAPKTPAPDPFERVTYNGHLMDQKTKLFIQVMERDLPDLAPLTVEQGCYNPGGVAASAGTHDGGGVFDLAPFDFGRKVKVARTRGGCAWHRPFNWDGRNGGEHIHCVIRAEGKLSPAAAAQVVQFDAGTDGLAQHRADSNRFHPQPPVTFDYAAAWREING